MIFYDIIIYVIIFIFFSLLDLVFNYSGNLFYLLIFFESIMLSLIMNYIFISILLDDPRCVIYALVLFAIAAVESAIGLSLILLYQRSSGHIFLKKNLYI